MARGIRPDQLRADMELGRYVRSMVQEFERLGLPKVTPFARMEGRGGHPALTADDPTMELVARWFATIRADQKDLMFTRYVPGDHAHYRARGMLWTKSRVYVEYDRLLSELAGVLKIGDHFIPENKTAKLAG